MSGSYCRCPSCNARLKLTGESPVGKRITCPQCHTPFRVPETEEVFEAELVQPAPPEPADGVEPERQPQGRKKQLRPKKSSSKALVLVSAAIGAVLLLGGGGWGIWMIVKNRSNSAANAKPGSANFNANNPAPVTGNPGNPDRTPPAPAFEIGSAAPEIEGEDIDGQRFKLSDYRGKVVLLDFWGHW